MANLKDVKVIDMGDGNPTKIKYRGEEYEKTENFPGIDGIALRVSFPVEGVAELGKYYRLDLTEHGPAYICEDGGVMTYGADDSRFLYFRKTREANNVDEKLIIINSQITDLQIKVEELTKLETDTRKGDYIYKGDIVRVLSDHYGHSYGTIGVAVISGEPMSISVEANGEKYLHRVELVAPASARDDVD